MAGRLRKKKRGFNPQALLTRSLVVYSVSDFPGRKSKMRRPKYDGNLGKRLTDLRWDWIPGRASPCEPWGSELRLPGMTFSSWFQGFARASSKKKIMMHFYEIAKYFWKNLYAAVKL